MSRYSPGRSYAHDFKKLGDNWYRLFWFVDYYYSGVRSRFPRQFRRDTDEAGAKRFCKRWNIDMPEPVTKDPSQAS
jgi:hypothetical protein